MILIPRHLAAALILPVFLTGVSCQKEGGSTPGGSARAPDMNSPAQTERTEFNRFRDETRHLYNDRKFAELEALATKLRETKERFPDGEWKLLEFYNAQDPADEDPVSMWELHDKIHGEWVKAYPESITARVAQARFYLAYAWQARGNGFASEVTRKGWEDFNERLAKAHSVLDESKPLKPGCPVWYSTMMRIALGEGWERADYDALVKEAKAFAPEYHMYDLIRANYLLPRWHGEEGEWEAVAEKEIALQGAAGAGIYARVVTQNGKYHGNVFGETDASWRKTRDGYEDLLTAFPDSPKLLNRYCRLACLAGDKKQAQKLFARIGDDKAPGVWYKGEFDEARKWGSAGK
ncbi:MAG: DUF4034 domain-containing protein [Verrucomicrobiaceae bacterium]|nr:MAG: DUF4034 domain-containing protein [Verrucomicrobiaceae bacterium]